MLGHPYPTIDKNKCISCEKCREVCPIDKRETNNFEQRAYVAYSQTKNVRYNGSSGGMFETFARRLIANGYSVYGAAFDQNLKLRCTVATSENELAPLCKSKYLHSDMGSKYGEIKEKLIQGEKVFFVSTPCQTQALKSFLGRSYENLITVDFFCHGVPSQRFFEECLAFDENKIGGKIVEYKFRIKKKHGSTPHYYSIKYKKAGKVKTKTDYYFGSTFYAFFQRYLSLRESCYNCSFAGSNRASDITIGDFHDVDRYVNGINRFDGVSMVIVNTAKGNELFEACKETLFVRKMDLISLIERGSCFAGGTKAPAAREEFLLDYQTMDICSLAKKYVSPKRYVKMRLYYSLPRTIRDLVKKCFGE